MASASASGVPEAAEALRGHRILSSRLYLDDVPTSQVHSESYLNSLKSSKKVARIVEVPAVALLPNFLVQQKLLYPFRKHLNVGGSVLSAKLALERGWAINIGGGFHHCSAEEGSGFCAYADIALCIQFAFIRLNISRVMIIDLDAHQGNGHEKDFGNDGRVYTLDMYNSGIYPFEHVAKKYIDQKVELDSGTKTEDYLENLDKALKVAECRFQPQLIVYNAGTDILDGDPLGRLKVSPEDVAIRDEKVFRFAKDQNIPLLMLTSGGDFSHHSLIYCLDPVNQFALKLFQEKFLHELWLRATRVWSLAFLFQLVLAGHHLWRANLQRMPDDLVESPLLDVNPPTRARSVVQDSCRYAA
ncbi:Histone deacetylase 2 [Dichanthelium oligosanthes]|uniref:Histone deacetylase 2 n=1 Tax=Dichanthelium oligosanthes TaxID=888268 RepID=A0A1E5WDF5_9POAL|nr:Histone deacetylase 2 [Dichanthelium oligosanthes]